MSVATGSLLGTICAMAGEKKTNAHHSTAKSPIDRNIGKEGPAQDIIFVIIYAFYFGAAVPARLPETSDSCIRFQGLNWGAKLPRRRLAEPIIDRFYGFVSYG